MLWMQFWGGNTDISAEPSGNFGERGRPADGCLREAGLPSVWARRRRPPRGVPGDWMSDRLKSRRSLTRAAVHPRSSPSHSHRLTGAAALPTAALPPRLLPQPCRFLPPPGRLLQAPRSSSKPPAPGRHENGAAAPLTESGSQAAMETKALVSSAPRKPRHTAGLGLRKKCGRRHVLRPSKSSNRGFENE